MIKILNLTGNPRQIGLQHGEQVISLRSKIRDSMQTRLADLKLSNLDFSAYKKEIIGIWEQYSPDTLEVLAGIAEALQIDWDEYFTYITAYYLKNRISATRESDGCTTWAASGTVTRTNATILAKNREENPVLRPLQCLAHVQPKQGYAYLCLTSAGNPGVSSSGINCAGLAVADTYVASLDTGPGIPRYSFMAHLLENYASVLECEEYLYAVPHIGDGTVILADAKGEMAVFEIAHSVQMVRHSREGFIVSTNHFSEPETRDSWTDEGPLSLKGSSTERRLEVENRLRISVGQIDLSWSKSLMTQHGSRLNSICRHPEIDSKSYTLSSSIYLPQHKTLYLANGIPCQTPFESHKLICQ